jgi:hypothetical protein
LPLLDARPSISLMNPFMAHARIVLVVGIVLLVQASAMAQPTPATVPSAAPTPVCNGKYKGGGKPSAAEFMEILENHYKWLEIGGWYKDELANDPRRANLCDADLRGLDLTDANFDGANLSGAELTGADLETVDFFRTDLRNAKLMNVNLTGVHLIAANLTNAHLDGATVAFADFGYAQLGSVPNWLPNGVHGIESAQNLNLLRFDEPLPAFFKLRNRFKQRGVRSQVIAFNAAIWRFDLDRTDLQKQYVHGWLERAVNLIFFDYTCGYGESPGRPLVIVAGLMGIMTFVYVLAQVASGSKGGIWAIWDAHRIEQTDGSTRPERLDHGFPGAKTRFSVIFLAAYFSLLSATRIGWRELNVGTWITRIQPREYSLRATGWVRVVSGIQSLISVYLVALTILTYFETPFEY